MRTVVKWAAVNWTTGRRAIGRPVWTLSCVVWTLGPAAAAVVHSGCAKSKQVSVRNGGDPAPAAQGSGKASDADASAKGAEDSNADPSASGDSMARRAMSARAARAYQDGIAELQRGDLDAAESSFRKAFLVSAGHNTR